MFQDEKVSMTLLTKPQKISTGHRSLFVSLYASISFNVILERIIDKNYFKKWWPVQITYHSKIHKGVSKSKQHITLVLKEKRLKKRLGKNNFYLLHFTIFTHSKPPTKKPPSRLRD